MRENVDQNNFEYVHFSGSDYFNEDLKLGRKSSLYYHCTEILADRENWQAWKLLFPEIWVAMFVYLRLNILGLIVLRI